MKYLIFGGSGFIGQSLSNYLKGRGHVVKTVSRKSNADFKFDISDANQFVNINFKPEVIINAASRIPEKNITSTSPQYVKELFNTNVLGGVNIANWAVAENTPKIINLSTLVTVRKPWPKQLDESYMALPEGPHVGYGMSKLSQEQLMNECVRGAKTNLSHFRLSSVYAPNMVPIGIIFMLIDKCQINETISLTNAKNVTFDFIHVLDICKVIDEMSDTLKMPQIMNVANGNSISLMSLTLLIKKQTNSTSEVLNINTSETSTANIDVSLMKHHIGDCYNSFINIKDGLTEVINNMML